MTIKLLRYSVWHWSKYDSIVHYTVSRGKDLPSVAKFEISNTYPREEQRARAHEYCNYLNKIVDATEEAYSRNQLVDTLKR